MARAVLVLSLLLAAACEESRRPGGTVPPSTGRDAGPSADAQASNDAAPPGRDASGADAAAPGDAAPPGPDGGTSPAPDAQSFDDAALGSDAQALADAQPSFDAQSFADAQAAPDAQSFADAQAAPDAQPGLDAGSASSASQAIAALRARPDGPAVIVVDGAYVTSVRAAPLGNDLPGFSIQAERLGPALWIAIDPATLSPAPAAGDLVRLSVDAMATQPSSMLRQGSAVSGYARLASGASLAGLVQDVSAAPDLVSALGDYELELVRASGQLSSGFRPAGSAFVSARADTAGVAGSTELELRMPTTVYESLGLGIGCSFTVQNPLWRFTTKAQLQAFATGELGNLSCPAARLVTASAPRVGRVVLSFDRPIAGPVPSAQVTIPGALVTAVRPAATNLIVDMSGAQPSSSYTVQLGGNVRDVRGNLVDPGFRSASFTTPPPSALLRINEVNANVTAGCDLVELRAVSGGSLDGWSLKSRDIVMSSFAGLTVNTGDLVVVHGSGGNALCNPGALLGGETQFLSQNPSASYPSNFDGAYDWYSTQGGIVNTDTVLTLLDGAGAIADAVFLSDDPSGTTANATEDAAALAASLGEWSTASGTIPAGGFVDDSFCASAVVGLSRTGMASSGDSIYRTGSLDRDTAADWTLGPSSFGAPNPGQ